MRLLILGGILALGGCGGGGTTGTNYSDPPPMAEIVATPTPKASPTEAAPEETPVADNAAAEDVSDNGAVAADAASNAAE